MEEFEEMEMPTPCIHCGDLFDLNDGYGSDKWHPNITICDKCHEEEEKEIERDEEIEDYIDNLSDAEENVKRYRKLLTELGVDLPEKKQNITCLMDKAAKWDKLDEEISKFYGDEEEEQGTLLDIGEAAARAFGYL
ncbi:hypothetical protein [Chryseobacterium vrystaatense]|uniref:hypothetical protein n=1 Tax=Chryseobacterium vrystaatense TaxID=307480 RepID=UPI000550F9E7|nr:hypothetical protein [Chryseobacterium vrystaatense]